VAAALALLAPLSYGPLFMLPLFVLAVRAGFVGREGESTASIQAAITH
jgi:hypothetical protein